jgi:hypothetical protein
VLQHGVRHNKQVVEMLNVFGAKTTKCFKSDFPVPSGPNPQICLGTPLEKTQHMSQTSWRLEPAAVARSLFF